MATNVRNSSSSASRSATRRSNRRTFFFTSHAPSTCRRRYAGGLTAGLVALALLAGCSGDGGNDLADAFCRDLKAGLTPMQILGATDDPSKAADNAYAYAAIGCPEELQTNEALRTYLEAWGINPDA